MTSQNDTFPFNLSDISGWVIRRKDGTTTKYNLISAEDLNRQSTSKGKSITAPSSGVWSWKGKTSYSQWCDHEPHPDKGFPAIFQQEGIAIWVGDCMGARKCYREFDVCIDGGNVLDIKGEYDLPLLYGDPVLKSKLSRFITSKSSGVQDQGSTRILKIRWPDRGVPPVTPEFWPALLKELKSARDKGNFNDTNPLRVMTICQGGHGRSGSAAAILTMLLSDYSPLDALTHIRAIHCARAIESKDQHEYLNKVAAMLGREQDAFEAEGVSSFKSRLLKMDSAYAQPYKARIEEGTAAKLEQREGSYL